MVRTSFLPKGSLYIRILALAALAGCAKPGSEHLSFDEAKSSKRRAEVLFKRRCPHVKNPTQAELKTYESDLNRLNPDPLNSPWVKVLGTNLVPPPCPVRIRTCPDQGVWKLPDSRPKKAEKPKSKTHRRRIHRPRPRIKKPDAGPSGVIIKP
jgi:hypothetical protein